MLRKLVRKALTGALRWAYNDNALQCQVDGHKHGRADELVGLCPAAQAVFELWRDEPPPWFVGFNEGLQLMAQGLDSFSTSMSDGHNAYAAAHDDLAQRYEALVESHNRVRDLSVELAHQLIEQRQARAADVEDTLKVLQAAGEKVVLLDERVRSLEAQEGVSVVERTVH